MNYNLDSYPPKIKIRLKVIVPVKVRFQISEKKRNQRTARV